VYEFATTWSRRPLQTLLLAGLAYYVLSKKLGRISQVALLLVRSSPDNLP